MCTCTVDSAKISTQAGNAGMAFFMAIEGIGGLVDIVVLIILQGLLFVVHRSGDSGDSGANNGKPSGAEFTVGLAMFWTCYLCIEHIFRCLQERLGDLLNGGHVLDGVVSLTSKVVLTWYLHLVLVFFVDTLVPFIHELRQTPQATLKEIQTRFKEITIFFKTIFQHPLANISLTKATPIPEKVEKTSKGAISLERRQTDHPKEGNRRLSWSIVLNKEILDEMKETLGPPGGFGELGFNIAKDGVRFEAMGVGTSFNLCFRLRDEGETRAKEGKKMRRRYT